jgi:hypothetical protein
MPTSKFVPDPEFFSDPDGICSLAVAKKAGIRYADPPDGTELIPLVVSGSPPAPSKVRLLFGHQVTKANAKHHGASTQFYSAPAALQARLKAETLLLNPVGEKSASFDTARLHKLRSSPIGGMLLVVSHWDTDAASFGDPVIQVLASPAVASLGSFNRTDRPGINLGEAWDLTSAPFDEMPISDTTCPLLAMSSGSSRAVYPFTLANYLSSTAPLFVPSGEDVASTVSIFPNVPILRAFYLPAEASLPIGMFWSPTDLTPEIMIRSIKALSSSTPSPYAPFIQVLEALGRRLHDWLTHATSHPLRFSCKVYRFDTIEDQFPSLITGAVPDTVLCTATFAPLMDMRYLYAWRLLVDRVLSGTSEQDIQFLRLFLSRASACLHSGTYIGVDLLPELTPNMGIHFRARGGWPTAPDPLLDFSRIEVSSQQAQRYTCIQIEVHPDHPAPAADVRLITASEASALRHHALTPKTSLAPAESLATRLLQHSSPSSLTLSKSLLATPLSKGSRAQSQSAFATPLDPSRSTGSSTDPITTSTPAGINLFGSSTIYSPPSQKQAPSRSSTSASAALQAASLGTLPAPPKWSEILTWSIATPTSRLACAPEYLALCLLLIHGPACLDVNASNYRVRVLLDRPREKQLLARFPCAHFSTRMALPIFSTAAIGVVDSARIYMQGLIDRLGEGYFTQFFTQSFFQAPVLKALMQPNSWRMDPAYEPSECDVSSFHVYNFLPCLRRFTAHPALLPAEGITCLELRPLALFISTWFRSMDVAQGFESAKFDDSILGCRLRYLMLLLDRHPVQALWATQARTMTYVWFKSLGSLLYLFQRLASSSMWKDSAGFLPADPNVHICPYDGEGHHFLNIVQDFDADIILQWSRDRLRNAEAFYPVSTIPSSHFVHVPAPRLPASLGGPSPQDGPSKQPGRGQKRQASDAAPDFVAVQPLFEMATAPLTEKACFMAFAKAPPNGTRMPRLINPNGTSSLICFSSAAGPPFNKCNIEGCIRKQKAGTRNPRHQNPNGPPPFCHVDLTQPYWANQPEAFWNPVVEWLRLPGVSNAIRPSEFLKRRTPSTPW